MSETKVQQAKTWKDVTLKSITQTSAFKQASVWVLLAATVIIAIGLVSLLRTPSLQPLASNLSAKGLSELAEILERESYTDFEVDTQRGTVLVPSDDIASLRFTLAKEGFDNNNEDGWNLFNAERPLGTTKFRENVNYTRAKEGEIKRSIESLYQVLEARVNLAITDNSSFLNDQNESTASVTLRIKDGYPLSRRHITAIQNLVSYGVNNLKPENVSVVDQHLKYLSLESDSSYDDEQLGHKSKIEKGLKSKITSILAPLVGGKRKIAANVTAVIDFDHLEQTSEQFISDDSAIKSQQEYNEQRNRNTEGAVPGALTDTPPAAVTATEFDIQKQKNQSQPEHKKSESTLNYEVGKVVSHNKKAKGRIMRLSAAILLDMPTVENEDGETVEAPFSQEKLDKIEDMVKKAIGFSDARGDEISILFAPFAPVEEYSIPEIPFWKDPAFAQLITNLFIGGLGITVLLILKNTVFSTVQRIENESEEKIVEKIREIAPETDDIEEDNRSEEQQFAQSLDRSIKTVSTDPDISTQVLQDWVREDKARESFKGAQ